MRISVSNHLADEPNKTRKNLEYSIIDAQQKKFKWVESRSCLEEGCRRKLLLTRRNAISQILTAMDDIYQSRLTVYLVSRLENQPTGTILYFCGSWVIFANSVEMKVLHKRPLSQELLRTLKNHTLSCFLRCIHYITLMFKAYGKIID